MKTSTIIRLAATALCLLPLMGNAIPPKTEQPFNPPIMGWSSWNTYRVNINDSLIKTSQSFNRQWAESEGIRLHQHR